MVMNNNFEAKVFQFKKIACLFALDMTRKARGLGILTSLHLLDHKIPVVCLGMYVAQDIQRLFKMIFLHPVLSLNIKASFDIF